MPKGTKENEMYAKIYPNEQHKAFHKYYQKKEQVNGVLILEGQKLFIDGRPALIIRAWSLGVRTKHLIAVCAKPQEHIQGYALANLMLETAIALDPQTPSYRECNIRITRRDDNFDVLAYSDRLAKIYENS